MGDPIEPAEPEWFPLSYMIAPRPPSIIVPGAPEPEPEVLLVAAEVIALLRLRDREGFTAADVAASLEQNVTEIRSRA